jgi:hypothetical protein
MKPIMIVDWSVVSRTAHPYQAPELGYPALQGKAYGHPKFEDGTLITTSKIIGKTECENSILTKNSLYVLGAIDTEYEKLYPDARSRLLNSLKLLEVPNV